MSNTLNEKRYLKELENMPAEKVARAFDRYQDSAADLAEMWLNAVSNTDKKKIVLKYLKRSSADYVKAILVEAKNK